MLLSADVDIRASQWMKSDISVIWQLSVEIPTETGLRIIQSLSRNWKESGEPSSMGKNVKARVFPRAQSDRNSKVCINYQRLGSGPMEEGCVV